MAKELIERLEKAEGGSRELDRAILDFLEPDGADERHWGLDYPAYTTDLNAALALVEEKRPDFTAWEIRSRQKKKLFTAELSKLDSNGGEYVASGTAKSPALALLIALLRSLQKEQKND